MVAYGAVAEAIREMPIMAGSDWAEGPVSLPSCIPQSELDDKKTPWQRAGRPCPYVTLSPANVAAADVVVHSLTEHTRGLAEIYARTVVEDLPRDDRAAFLERVFAALDSDPLKPKPCSPPTGGAPRG